jgi:hypothetical protein
MTQAPAATNDQGFQDNQEFQDDQGFQETQPVQTNQAVATSVNPESTVTNKSNTYRTIAFAVIFIGFGIFMLLDPHMMDNATSATGRNALIKNLLIMVWGIPGGIAAIVVGSFFGYRAFTQLRSSAAPATLTPAIATAAPAIASKPASKLSFSLKGDSSKAFADKVAPSKRELEAQSAKRRAQRSKK